jgi:hypothetical protein
MADNEGAESGQDNANIGAQDDQSTGEMPGEGTEGDEDGEVDDGEVTITIGEEPPTPNEEETAAPVWVKELRKTNRELARENRELKQKQAPAAQQASAMQKPTMADCDFDEEAFEVKLLAWQKQQSHAEAEQQKKVDQEKKAQDEWNATLETHGKAKAALKVGDYDDAEAEALEVLSVTQQGIIVSGADNSAVVMYALGKNPAKAKELASITNPVKFAFAIAKLESQLKVTPRKAPPPPEKHVHGSAPVTAGGDSTLERLRADAEKSGDMSKVMAYKKQKRAA